MKLQQYNLSGWDYTEETDNGITRPDLALLNASASVYLTILKRNFRRTIVFCQNTVHEILFIMQPFVYIRGS